MKSHAARRRSLTGSATVVGAIVLCGCSFTNPAGTTMNNSVTDGTNAAGEDLRIRNMLIVADTDHERGRVLGTIINDSQEDMTVSIDVAGESADVFIAEQGSRQLEEGEPLIFDRAGARPGSMATVTLDSPGHSLTVLIPVVDDTLPYYAPYAP